MEKRREQQAAVGVRRYVRTTDASSVSYTHLDVYKRQPLHGTTNKASLLVPLISLCFILLITINSNLQIINCWGVKFVSCSQISLESTAICRKDNQERD